MSDFAKMGVKYLRLSVQNSNGYWVKIKTPNTYKPVLATTSTEDSDRNQDLKMENKTMGTIMGYDMTWDSISWSDLTTILNLMICHPEQIDGSFVIPKRDSFKFYHPTPLVIPELDIDPILYEPCPVDPTIGVPPITGWVISEFYVSDFNMEAINLDEFTQRWGGLSISVRSIYPIETEIS